MSDVEKGNLRVEITSVDGNLTHPFKRTDTVADVQAFAYKRLVSDQSAVPITATTMEFGGQLVDGATTLDALAGGGKPGRELDLSLALTWVSQGG